MINTEEWKRIVNGEPETGQDAYPLSNKKHMSRKSEFSSRVREFMIFLKCHVFRFFEKLGDRFNVKCKG